MRFLILSGFMFGTTAALAFAQAPALESVTIAENLSLENKDAAKRAVKHPEPKTQPQQTGYVRPDAQTRRRRYINNMFGLTSIASTVASAGILTARNSPREWGPHWQGFGKRIASNFGQNIIRYTIAYGLDETLKLDSHFYPSRKRDTGSRVANAFISSVTARNVKGKRVIGFPRITGIYSSSIIAAEGWYPPRYNYKDGLRSGTISLGMSAVFNLMREFLLRR